MIIQWSGESVREALACLRRAEQGLLGCIQQAASVRKAMDEANPDGENKALNEALEHFETCEQRLKDLLAGVEEYEERTRRTNARFEEAEESLLSLVERLDGFLTAPPDYRGNGNVHWQPKAYAAAPRMRVEAAPSPAWLEDVTENAYFV